nr:wax ester/triacylglycerol synthase domain-containing protein [Rhodococcus sp. (in: high G+C Gram-positive bacteria)]
MSRLDVIDASFHYASKRVSRDQYVLLAFDCGAGAVPTFEEISEFVAERADRIPELGKRIREIPGNMDFPRWIADDEPKSSRIVEIAADSWEEVQRSLGVMAQDPVDTRDAAWRVHVARGVDGVPHAGGRAIVVVFQVSHALADGSGASRLARLLFSTAPIEAGDVSGRLFDPRLRLPVALGAALALPYRLVHSRVAARRARRDFARARGAAPLDRDTPRAGIMGNADPTRARAVHVIPCTPRLFDSTPLSVTSIALTATGLATARYLDSVGESVPDTLNSLVPMALPEDVRWPAVNRLVNGTVELHQEIGDLAERAARIRASLRDSRTATTDPLLLNWITAENLIPAPIFITAHRRRSRQAPSVHAVPTSVLSNVTVVSVDRGPSGLELCGTPALFSGGFPMLGPTRSVSHGFYGLGDTVTVCVTACPDTFPDHARYARIVRDAVGDVVEATSEEV